MRFCRAILAPSHRRILTMDLSSSLTSTSNDETRALNALLDAFTCAFSPEDTANAYCRTNGDVNKSGDFLTKLQLSMPQGNELDSRVGTNLLPTAKAVEENFMENSNQTRTREKSQNFSASFCTVFSMLGKGSAQATTAPANTTSGKEPLKVELPE